MASKVLLFYSYTKILDTQAIMLWQKQLCQNLNLKGRIIIAVEGINATLEGEQKNIKKYTKELEKYNSFQDIYYKISDGNGSAFPKLSVKIRSEIVSSHLGERDVSPNVVTGSHIYPQQLHDWFRQEKEFYIVDMRNDYEQKVGYFQDSILSKFSNFRDLPTILERINHLKDKDIVTVCTGGVRCEKASGFLINNGFKKVYQLYGGIVNYMEKYPNKHFFGKLYVFDQRLVMGFNTKKADHKIVGKCDKCGTKSENFVNCSDPECHKHFICCHDCIEPDGKVFCSNTCKANYYRKQNQQLKAYS
ncbi:MAG: rhodanese-related sulfurtransferase [Patescibacteria group bacterium]